MLCVTLLSAARGLFRRVIGFERVALENMRLLKESKMKNQIRDLVTVHRPSVDALGIRVEFREPLRLLRRAPFHGGSGQFTHHAKEIEDQTFLAWARRQSLEVTRI